MQIAAISRPLTLKTFLFTWFVITILYVGYDALFEVLEFHNFPNTIFLNEFHGKKEKVSVNGLLEVVLGRVVFDENRSGVRTRFFHWFVLFRYDAAGERPHGSATHTQTISYPHAARLPTRRIIHVGWCSPDGLLQSVSRLCPFSHLAPCATEIEIDIRAR